MKTLMKILEVIAICMLTLFAGWFIISFIQVNVLHELPISVIPSWNLFVLMTNL